MGFKKLEELKDAVYMCTYCGTCKVAYTYGPPPLFAPICPQGERFKFDAYLGSRSKSAMAKAILTGATGWTDTLVNSLFTCNVCGGCEYQCQTDFKPEILHTIEALRYEAVKAGRFPKEHGRIAENVLKYRNPYGEDPERKEDWADSKYEGGELLYFVGCTAALRRPEIPKAAAEVFKALGIEFTILGKDEVCCGSPLIRTGQWDAAEQIMGETIDRIVETGITDVVTTCAGCYKTLTRDYASFDFKGYDKLKFQHITQYLLDKINPSSSLGMKVTYHDPCHLGRQAEVYEEPREILRKIGAELIEMPRNRGNAYCCGAGGGVKGAFPDLALETSKKRVEEAESLGIEAIVTACPFCVRNLQDAEPSVPVYDIIELVRKTL